MNPRLRSAGLIAHLRTTTRSSQPPPRCGTGPRSPRPPLAGTRPGQGIQANRVSPGPLARCVNAPHLVALVLAGARVGGGVLVEHAEGIAAWPQARSSRQRQGTPNSAFSCIRPPWALTSARSGAGTAPPGVTTTFALIAYPSSVHTKTPKPAKNPPRDACTRGRRIEARGAEQAGSRMPPSDRTRSRPSQQSGKSVPRVRGQNGEQAAGCPALGSQEKVRPGVTRMFASVVPGMAQLVRRMMDRIPGVQVTDVGFDGRSDLVLFEVGRGYREVLWSLRTIEDLFVEVGRTMRSGGDKANSIAGRIWRPEGVEKALSVWAAEHRPLAGTMTYRVIARVLQESSFLRTDLRKALTQSISAEKPKWRVADPSQIEVWISEYQAGRIVAGLRLSDASMRQHDGREAERSGALRPTVAATMVSLAGEPDGILLDPCCGSGTILSEAIAVGWNDVRGGDADLDAVEIARRNAPTANVKQWDVRRLGLPDCICQRGGHEPSFRPTVQCSRSNVYMACRESGRNGARNAAGWMPRLARTRDSPRHRSS